MPGMVLFGRRWAIASDDLVFPGVFELLVRVLWWVGILMLYLMHRGKLDCPGGGLLSSYLIVLLVLLAVIIGTVSAIVCVSMKEIFAGQGTFTPHEGWMTVCPGLLREDTCMMPNRAQLTHQGSASI